MRILMSVETKRSTLPKIRKFTSTGDALDYMIKKGFKTKYVTVEEIKDGKVVARGNTLSTRTMGYVY